MNRRTKRFIRRTFLIFTVMLAIILFVLASFQLSLSNPIGMAVMVLTGGYISTFVYVNEGEQK
jgi:pilus assembly protein TadC